MGFDLYGVRAKSETGEYFRNNVWWWRMLWEYTCQVCESILTPKDVEAGCYNDNHLINQGKTIKMVALLEESIKDGTAKKFADMIKKEAKQAKVDNKSLQPGDPKWNWASEYPFTITNVKEFVAFLKESGGFRIC